MAALVLAGAASLVGLPEPASAQESALAAAKSRGRLIVGVKYDFPPFGFVNEQKQVVGFEIDLAREFARRLLGSPDAVELIEVSGPNRIPFLVTNKVDLVIATMTITPERAKTIDFSAPYYTGGYTIMVGKDNGSIARMADLAGKRVVVTRGSTADTIVSRLSPAPAQILKLEHISELFSAMQAGHVEAAVQDIALMQPFVKRNPGFKLVGGLYNEEAWGIGVRKGDKAALDFVNESLNALRQNGKIDESLARWGLK